MSDYFLDLVRGSYDLSRVLTRLDRLLTHENSGYDVIAQRFIDKEYFRLQDVLLEKNQFMLVEYYGGVKNELYKNQLLGEVVDL